MAHLGVYLSDCDLVNFQNLSKLNICRYITLHAQYIFEIPKLHYILMANLPNSMLPIFHTIMVDKPTYMHISHIEKCYSNVSR